MRWPKNHRSMRYERFLDIAGYAVKLYIGQNGLTRLSPKAPGSLQNISHNSSSRAMSSDCAKWYRKLTMQRSQSKFMSPGRTYVSSGDIPGVRKKKFGKIAAVLWYYKRLATKKSESAGRLRVLCLTAPQLPGVFFPASQLPSVLSNGSYCWVARDRKLNA